MYKTFNNNVNNITFLLFKLISQKHFSLPAGVNIGDG